MSELLRPTQHIAAGAKEHRTLRRDLDNLSEHDAQRPSRLPDWSRKHVIAHLAHKANSHAALFTGVACNETPVQYPRGQDAARDEVTELASKPIDLLRSELSAAFAALQRGWHDLPDAYWSRTAISSAGERNMVEFVHRHLRDIFVHHADLDIGYEPRDWPKIFVETEFPKRLADLGRRADERAILAWLLGRAPSPELEPW